MNVTHASASSGRDAFPRRQRSRWRARTLWPREMRVSECGGTSGCSGCTRCWRGWDDGRLVRVRDDRQWSGRRRGRGRKGRLLLLLLHLLFVVRHGVNEVAQVGRRRGSRGRNRLPLHRLLHGRPGRAGRSDERSATDRERVEEARGRKQGSVRGRGRCRVFWRSFLHVVLRFAMI